MPPKLKRSKSLPSIPSIPSMPSLPKPWTDSPKRKAGKRIADMKDKVKKTGYNVFNTTYDKAKDITADLDVKAAKIKKGYDTNIKDFDGKTFLNKISGSDYFKRDFKNSDDKNPILKVIKFFETTLSDNKSILTKFTCKYINHVDTINKIPRTLLIYVSAFVIITELIIALISPVIQAIPAIGKPLDNLLKFFSLPKEIYYLVYGFLKFAVYVIILLSVIILIEKHSTCFNNPIIDLLYIFIVIILSILPFIYDLLSYIIHLAVLHGFYKYKCKRDADADENVIANKAVIIDYIKYVVLFIGLISFIYYFLRQYLTRGTMKLDEYQFIENLPLYMLLVPIFYIGIVTLTDFIENELSNVITFMMTQSDDDIPENTNCVTAPGSCENADESSITNLLKLIIYSVIAVVIIIIQKQDEVSEKFRDFIKSLGKTFTTNLSELVPTIKCTQSKNVIDCPVKV
tara:strand:+ start:2801 stop:4174 length:1374 start_codon:yes stop_codon:yes gene_type:complete